MAKRRTVRRRKLSFRELGFKSQAEYKSWKDRERARKRKESAATKAAGFPRGASYLPYCKHCGIAVESYTCKMKGCQHRRKHETFWFTTRKIWMKLPKKWRGKILCKKCFKNLSGVSPGPQVWDPKKIWPGGLRTNPAASRRKGLY
jgi:hypothetical protein